jgi:Trk K+ transport system NAD-binding subunit
MRIQDIDMPEECVVGAVIREGTFVVPRGHTEIRDRDHVVFVGPPPAVQEAHATFSRAAAAG